MQNYELIIFDLDGTLADTSEGIYNAHKYANVQMGRGEPSEAELCGIIGAPLLDSYIGRFGYERNEAQRAVRIYREWYGKYGVNQVKLYENIYKMLRILRHKKYRLAVATLKAENLAKNVLEYLGIAQFFELIRGVDENDTLSKCDLINLCIGELKGRKETSVLVGDSMHDLSGAKEAGIDFIAVRYGFGSFEPGMLDMTKSVDKPLEILNIL